MIRATEEFVSEGITPVGAGRDTAAMSRGEPGAPEAFKWRDRTHRVQAVLRSWKQSGPEPTGEVYLRRHCFDLLMDSGERWVVYFQRQSPKSGHPKRRWFLYSVRAPGSERDPPKADSSEGDTP